MYNDQQDDHAKKSFAILLLLIIIFLAEWLLFRSYVIRELAWSPYLHDDETWYLPGSYETFEYIISNQKIPEFLFKSPHGILYYLQASLFYLFFGASRLSALTLNLVYYILWQIIVFVSVYKITLNKNISIYALTLAMIIPGPMFLTTMVYFDHGFIAMAMFWIFMCIVIGSNIFVDKKWSFFAGLISGLLILQRFYYASFLAAAYFILLIYNSIGFLFNRRKSEKVKLKERNMTRIKNIIGSGILTTIIAGPILWKMKDLLFEHFFKPISGVSVEQDYLFWGSKAGFGLKKYLFYPLQAKNMFSNDYFIISISVLIVTLILLIFSLISNRISIKNEDVESAYKVNLSGIQTIIFIGSCLFIPYFQLTSRVNKAGGLSGVFLSSIFWIVLLSTIYFTVKGVSLLQKGKILSRIMIYVAAFGIIIGLSFQIRLYSNHAKPLSTPEIKNDMDEINHLFDDMGIICKKNEWTKPGISVDNWIWYLYGNAWNLKSVHYERQGKILDIQPRLGQSMFPVDLKKAVRLVRASNMVIIGIPQEGYYPVLENEKETLPKIWEIVKSEFKFYSSYSIEGSNISLYYNPRSYTVKASSEGAGHYGFKAFDGSTESDDFWEGGGFPITLEVEFIAPMIIKQYELKSGYTAEDSMPMAWKLQGSQDGVVWNDLDLRTDQTGWKTFDKREYEVKSSTEYKFYKFTFTKGNHPHAVRIYEIKIM